MIENIDENSNFSFVKEINDDFKKISQVLHSSNNNFPNNKIELIDNIIKNINLSLLNFLKIHSNLYEQLIQKTEMQLRFHIKNEYMLKLQKDALEHKIKNLLIRDEEYEKLKQLTNVIVENGHFILNDRKENEIIILKAENSNLKKAINKFEKEIEKKNRREKELKNEIQIIIETYDKKLNELKKNLTPTKKTKHSNSSININDISSNIKLNRNNSSNKVKQLNNSINSLNHSKSNNINIYLNNSPTIIDNIKNPIKITTPYNYKLQNIKEPYKEIQNNFKNKHRRYKSEFYINKLKEFNNNSFKNILSPMKKLIETSSTTNSKGKVSNLKYSSNIKSNRNSQKNFSNSKLKSFKGESQINNLLLNTKSMINNFITYRNPNVNNLSLSGSNFLNYKSHY
jgi:hypothetical protein